MFHKNGQPSPQKTRLKNSSFPNGSNPWKISVREIEFWLKALGHYVSFLSVADFVTPLWYFQRTKNGTRKSYFKYFSVHTWYTYYIRIIYAQCASRCLWRFLLYTLLSNYLERRIYCLNGPNAVWHCDGYDKIKQYGFPIHGGVDGVDVFSRILSLKVVRSNNNPIIPSALYLRTIKEHGLCPNLSKTDCGLENSDIAAVYCFLTGSNLSHRYRASHANQRIKNWWWHIKCSFSVSGYRWL